MRNTVATIRPLKQFAKTPNAATSLPKTNPEPPGKHGMSVREIGGKAKEGPQMR